ncbi:MAG TPA: 2,3-dihydroxybiphenyl 1,2-dioxygenase [Alphaproteobacteria bacterium]|jgi:2,3-dihydroxybiphenyl 1,2-dioxygenase|uniref:VOC family protein n=1 Tax=Marinobacter alexandrii TaxID=2570351 RepID=UPI001109A6EE|nr:VOC family protein [Marinobacter alexandrii]HIO02516.1 2,3-dihydroxybiphenyl 1,2-dioxygenase [Alphaproteobacteria bacterium]|tara:strand:- start:2106 stop:3047 length:942 start_codon:yes stop_codon:yes gene_type:complete
MDIIGIGYLGFECTDVDAWRSYGPEVMGFGIGSNPENDSESLYLRMDDRRYRLALHPGEVDRLAYIGWEAKGRLEYMAALKKFRDEGVEFEVADEELCQKRGVKELIRFLDPVGFRHELFYGQKWTPQSFVPGRRHGGYLAGKRGLGHIVLMSPEYNRELEHFLINIMGFRWYGSGAGKGKTGFFRSKLNEYTSHDIAYGHAPGRMGVHHIGVFVNSIRDVGETYDIVKKKDLQLLMTLGQHSQDPHVSFYHYNPSGFAFECIGEIEPWHDDGFELNPEVMSVWGHEMVGPMLGSFIKTPEEVRDPEFKPKNG